MFPEIKKKKTNQLLGRITGTLNTETQEKFLLWVLIKGRIVQDNESCQQHPCSKETNEFRGAKLHSLVMAII